MAEIAKMKDLVVNVAKRQGLTQEQAEAVVSDVFDCIRYFLSQDIEVRLPKFGTFYVRHPKEEESYSPLVERMVKNKKGVRFRVHDALKAHVNEALSK